MIKELHLFIIITLIFFPALLIACKQNDKGLYDFIYESLEDFLNTELQPDKLMILSDKKESLNDYNLFENYSFIFEVVREKNTAHAEINCVNLSIENFSFQLNDILFLKEIFTPAEAPTALYLSLYRESELIIQKKADEGLCFSDKIFQFPGKYILTVTFQTNKIIQEACFQIEIN